MKRFDNSMKFYIETFGCQMNEADSEKLKALLIQKGLNKADSYTDADIIILNTCSIREKAESTAFQYLNQFRSHKRSDNPGKIIALGGCIGQEKSKELLKKFPGLDLVFGTETLLKVPSLLEEISRKRRRIYDTGWDMENRILKENVPWVKNGKITGFVPVSRGCNNYCSYCIVPFTRGEEKCRPFVSVIEEVEDAVDKGIREVTLLGQNVNSYRDGGSGFADLVEELDKIRDLKRIRFMTSHPRDLSVEIMRRLSGCSKLCEHYHLPLQSGSNRILELMNRGYTAEEYGEKIKFIRELKPDTAITTDIIVGFPGETEEDFEKTLRCVAEAEFDSAFMFLYSKRPNTKASEIKDTVPEDVKKGRIKTLIDLQEKISREKNEKLVGAKASVLVENICKKEEQKLFGKTRTNKPVVFMGDGRLTGQEVNLKIINATPHTLTGEIIK